MADSTSRPATLPATPPAAGRLAPSVAAGLAVWLAYTVVTVAVQASAGIPYADWFKTAANTWRTGVASLVAGSLLLLLVLALTRWSFVWRDPQPLGSTRVMRVAMGLWWLAVVVRLAGVRWAEVPVDLLAAVLATGVLVGFAEELAFRGFFLRALRQGGRPESSAALWTALAFGLFHLPNVFMGTGVAGLAQLVLAATSGAVLYAFRCHFGRLWPAMLAHGAWDVAAFLASNFGQPWLLPASLGLQGLMLVLGVVVLVGVVRGGRGTVVLRGDKAAPA